MKNKKFNPAKLTSAREKRAISYLELARELQKVEPKASKQSVWQWETGKSTPSFRYLSALSYVLHKPIEFFFKS